MSNYPATPHINVADEICFGKTVLMPGDPLRSKFIAEHFLENPVLVNNVRGVHGYTGWYKGVKVSVMAAGHRHLFPRAVQLLRCGEHHPGRVCRIHSGSY